MIKDTIAFYTFGCRLNQSETAAVERSFLSDGYRIVDIKKPADIVVINTCTVTENGDTDTRRLVNRINRLNPHVRIALIGCQAQVQKSRLTELPNVRWVIGNARKMELLDILREQDTPRRPRVITPVIPRNDFTIPIVSLDHRHTRANIKIQDGCDFFCSFCEIPYARGRARSRVFTDIIREAQTMAVAGHKELVITGINVGTYKQNHKTIYDVIAALEQLTGIERIRISSIEPTTIPLSAIKHMAGRTKLCRHLHIPLQSASDRILRSMKRKYRARQFKDFIEMVKSIVPDVCVGTDAIVGYPGESDGDFQSTYDAVRDWPIDYAHVFSYSERYLAKSRALGEKVETYLIGARSRRLRELSARKRSIFHDTLLGTRQMVIFEQKKNGYWLGLTDNYIRVKVPSARKLNNQFLPVVLKRKAGDLIMSELSHE